MSYDIMEGRPDDLKIYVGVYHRLRISFTCPRREHLVNQEIKSEDLIHGFEIECKHPACVGPGERYGYQLELLPRWKESYLGLNDRPLHPEVKKTKGEKHGR